MVGSTRKWAWYWGAWTFLALYMASWDMAMSKGSLALRLLGLNAVQNLVWGILGLILVQLAERRPIQGLSRSQAGTWALHLVASVAVAALGLFLAYLANLVFLDGPWNQPGKGGPWVLLPAFYRSYFHTNLLFMWALLGALHFHLIYRKYRARELEAAQLQARFAEARNQALRMQLQPHFLFNTLNSISALVESSPRDADRMISRLGDFLRMTLDASPEQLVPLRRELAFIEAYLGIERIRFQERLSVRVEVPAELMGARVPAFILQPLVENALKHGLSGRARGGTVILRARRDTDLLLLEVQDDGEGFVSGMEGVGLSNVRSRMGLLYAGRHRLDILGSPGRGTLVVLGMPLDMPVAP